MLSREVRQVAKFVLNGLFATAVHFCTLTVLVEGAGVESKGLANALAASFGIAASFAGNKWFVFSESQGHTGGQLTRFLVLYGTLALINGGLMTLWADVGGLDYRIGFVIISAVQLICSFLGNRILVFKA